MPWATSVWSMPTAMFRDDVPVRANLDDELVWIVHQKPPSIYQGKLKAGCRRADDLEQTAAMAAAADLGYGNPEKRAATRDGCRSGLVRMWLVHPIGYYEISVTPDCRCRFRFRAASRPRDLKGGDVVTALRPGVLSTICAARDLLDHEGRLGTSCLPDAPADVLRRPEALITEFQ